MVIKQGYIRFDSVTLVRASRVRNCATVNYIIDVRQIPGTVLPIKYSCLRRLHHLARLFVFMQNLFSGWLVGWQFEYSHWPRLFTRSLDWQTWLVSGILNPFIECTSKQSVYNWFIVLVLHSIRAHTTCANSIYCRIGDRVLVEYIQIELLWVANNRALPSPEHWSHSQVAYSTEINFFSCQHTNTWNRFPRAFSSEQIMEWKHNRTINTVAPTQPTIQPT